jgi:hypothetical protein
MVFVYGLAPPLAYRGSDRPPGEVIGAKSLRCLAATTKGLEGIARHGN